MAEEKPRTVFVAVHPELGDRVGIWERHPDHPGGEVFVSGQNSEPVEVALTGAVLEALAPSGDRGEGYPRLVRLEGPVLEKRRQLAQQYQQEGRLQTTVTAIASGASPADVAAAEKRDEELVGLQEQIAKLNAELQEARTENAEALKEQAEREINDPDLREQRAAELEQVNSGAKEPAQIDTYDADEPRQSLDVNRRGATSEHQRRRQRTGQPESTLAPGTVTGQGGGE